MTECQVDTKCLGLCFRIALPTETKGVAKVSLLDQAVIAEAHRPVQGVEAGVVVGALEDARLWMAEKAYLM